MELKGVNMVIDADHEWQKIKVKFFLVGLFILALKKGS